ncbi:MAG: carboxypeptidase-like regulatory domain-containing protein [bacterium]|nr:carboxypeptidase-like regulatory domain-containing protein [bacterium]
MTNNLRLTTKTKIAILSSVVCCLSLVTPLAQAQGLSSQVLSLSIVNPSGPISQVRVVFNIPSGFAPVDLGPQAIWDSVNKQITVNLGVFIPGETKPVNITLSAPPGVYTITGKTYGFWDDVAQPFETAIKPIVLVFQAPSSSLSTLPKQVEQIPAGSRAGTFLEDLAQQLKPNEEVIQVAETISLPVAVGLGGLGVVSLFASAYTSSASFAAALSRIASYIGFGLFRLKKRKPWGRVVNHLTGKPLQGAFVKILDVAFKKVKETQVTDHEGRFGFLVSPGDYLIRVSKNGFGEYETKAFQISEPDQVLNLEISLEPLTTTLADYALGLVRFWNRLNWFLAKINPVVLAFGLVASIISTLITPSPLNYVILGLYGVLIIINIILASILVRSYGRILDRGTGDPIALAVVRLFNVQENWLMGTHVSDQLGRFNFLLDPGSYYVTVARNEFAAYQSQPTHFSRAALLNFDIKLDRQ